MDVSTQLCWFDFFAQAISRPLNESVSMCIVLSTKR